MINVKNSAISVPSYMQHTAELLEGAQPISQEQKQKNVRNAARLAAIVRGQAEHKEKPSAEKYAELIMKADSNATRCSQLIAIKKALC